MRVRWITMTDPGKPIAMTDELFPSKGAALSAISRLPHGVSSIRRIIDQGSRLYVVVPKTRS